MRVVLIPMVLLLLAWLTAPTAAAPQRAEAPPLAVVAASVRIQPMSQEVEALGTLQANESVAITSRVTETISALHYDDSQRESA